MPSSSATPAPRPRSLSQSSATRRNRRRSSRSEKKPTSTRQVLSYVLFAYIVYQIFTRADDDLGLGIQSMGSTQAHHAAQSIASSTGYSGYPGLQHSPGGAYHLPFPNLPHPSSRQSSQHSNIFVMIIYYAFTGIIVYPGILLFNSLSFILHYASATLLLLLTMAHYLASPFTEFFTFIWSTCVSQPWGLFMSVINFFSPAWKLLGGLVGIGASVGGVVAVIAKKLEKLIWERDQKKKKSKQEAEDKMALEKSKILNKGYDAEEQYDDFDDGVTDNVHPSAYNASRPFRPVVGNGYSPFRAGTRRLSRGSASGKSGRRISFVEPPAASMSDEYEEDEYEPDLADVSNTFSDHYIPHPATPPSAFHFHFHPNGQVLSQPAVAQAVGEKYTLAAAKGLGSRSRGNGNDQHSNKSSQVNQNQNESSSSAESSVTGKSYRRGRREKGRLMSGVLDQNVASGVRKRARRLQEMDEPNKQVR